MSATTGPPLNLPFPVQTDPADGAEQMESLARAVAEHLVSVVWPTGSLMFAAFANAPPGFMICNGQTLSRVEWHELFDAIGTLYGAGDGSTTFNIPNLRECCIRVDHLALGWRGGADQVTLTEGQMPWHNHPAWQDGHQHGGSTDWRNVTGGQFAMTGNPPIFTGTGQAGTTGNPAPRIYPGGYWGGESGGHAHNLTTDWRAANVYTGQTGANQPHSNLPQVINVNGFIKT